jgi:hypothetical protein
VEPDKPAARHRPVFSRQSAHRILTRSNGAAGAGHFVCLAAVADPVAHRIKPPRLPSTLTTDFAIVETTFVLSLCDIKVKLVLF